MTQQQQQAAPTQRITIPTPEQLAERLTGLDALLTARRWERAAIVFAYTEIGEIGAGRWRKPTPPRLNLRDFARLGYAGLTSVKAVSRYRHAWTAAIEQGWATLAAPGQTVLLPTQPFPAWPYSAVSPEEPEDWADPDDPDDAAAADDDTPRGTLTEGGTLADEDIERLPAHGHPRAWRPVEQRVLANVGLAATALRRMAESVSTAELSSDVRAQLVDQLTELRAETDTALQALQGTPVLA